MTDDEAAFRAAIATAGDDLAPRQVFADWLDEHDRPDEATFHRSLTAETMAEARAWFDSFAAGHSRNPAYGEGDYDSFKHFSGIEALGAGREWLDSRGNRYGGEYFVQIGSDSLRDEMYDRDRREEFWRNFAVATGTYVAPEVAEDGYVFSCSC